MPVITADEAKQYLGITTTEHDPRIAAVLPTVQEFIITWCGRTFEASDIYLHSEMLAFAEGPPPVCTLGAGSFLTAGFRAGQDVKITGSRLNDGIRQIDTAEEALLTFVLGSPVQDEDADIGVMISLVRFPAALKPAAARMIAEDLRLGTGPDIASEKSGSYSVSYDNGAQGRYSEAVLRMLQPYKKVKVLW